MELKEGLEVNGTIVRSRRRYRWTDLSVLILSLLLAASVAAVVYMAVQPPATTCSKAPKTGKTLTEFELDVEVDNVKVPEKVAYDEEENVALFYDQEGHFVAEDFEKGWVVVSIDNSDECVVIPTGNSQNRSTVSSVMSSFASSGVVQGKNEGDSVHAQILPGFIEDRSMFNDEVNLMCNGGYRWLVTVDTGSDEAFEVGTTRHKRRADNCFCSLRIFIPIYVDSLFNVVLRSYWVCLDWTCFNSVCTLFDSCVLDLTHPLAGVLGLSTGNQTAMTNSTST